MSTSINPTEWGWKLVDNTYQPIITALDPAPEEILKFVRCKCSLSSKHPCGTNICGCKNGLKCFTACGNCHGIQCNNTDKNRELVYDDIDDEMDYTSEKIFDILQDL